MTSNSTVKPADGPLTRSKQRLILHRLVVCASTAVNSQLDAFSARMSAALLDGSSSATDAMDANLGFAAGNLLKNNTYPFYHVASSRIRAAFQDEVDALDSLVQSAHTLTVDQLSLVSYEEMEKRLLLERAARPIESANTALLKSVALRLAELLCRDELTQSDNPFRPSVLLAAIDSAWCEFAPDAESHHLLLREMQAGVIPDVVPVLQAVNQALIAAGMLPHMTDASPIRKSGENRKPASSPLPDPALMRQLRQLFSAPAAQTGGFLSTGGTAAGVPDTSAFASSGNTGTGEGASPGFPPLRPLEELSGHASAGSGQGSTGPAIMISPALSAYLRELQGSIASWKPATGGRVACRLDELKLRLPKETLTRADETTVDVMSRTFDAVFRDPNIPAEMKELIGYLQIPVLKAALLDKEFFFEETHPARRLMKLITTSSIGWDQSRGRDDPLFQAMERNVDRVQGPEVGVRIFAEVVSDLETCLGEEEIRVMQQIAAPITRALKHERLKEATRSATNDVATRVATGEVVTFVEDFLESRWVPVLTLAHSVREEKPQMLDSAIRTMDDLIWSVQPKITPQQRRELISKLPALLTTLNKWLNILKWDDADRLQFFADLAECHASIVRAPVELSPQRQLELAVEAAQKAAERRHKKRARAADEAPEPPHDEFLTRVESLERGMWFEFTQAEAEPRKLRLAWISPLRSLYIFTTVHREEAFSMAPEDLADSFRSGRAKVVEMGFVDQALRAVLIESEAAAEKPATIEPA